MSGTPADPAALLASLRDETRFELNLLHERVNTLLAAEAFLTIAYTATMSSSGRWSAVVAPVLAVLGLLLAALAWPGVSTTAQLVMALTYQFGNVVDGHPEALPSGAAGRGDRRAREIGQRRSLLLFRFAAPLFLSVWVVLLACSLLLRT